MKFDRNIKRFCSYISLKGDISTIPSISVNSIAVEFWEWISNFIPHNTAEYR